MEIRKSIVFLFLCLSICFCYDPASYKEAFFTQNLNHFSFSDDRTFQQRYLYNDDFFNPKDGTIFFYTGDIGDIVKLWNDNGFLYENAKTFSAIVVFCEHRYYGKSLPFGDESFSLKNIQYLTIEQALADYAVFLTNFKKSRGLNENNKVIAFGGFYGGILSAYMRFKYPNIVTGAISSSAPLYMTAGLTNSTLFFRGVTDNYKLIPGCAELIKSAYNIINITASLPEGYEKLSKQFNLCNPIKSINDYFQFLIWTMNSIATYARGNYPYSSSVFGNLPPWPVNSVCSLLEKEISQGIDILTAFKDIVGILYNNTNKICFDPYLEYVECSLSSGCGYGNDNKAFDYQGCTELNIVQDSNGITDMFLPLTYTNDMRQDQCKEKWNVTIRSDWTATQFWGQNIKSASNIVFSNGLLDPFHYGGQLANISNTVVAITTYNGAQQFDLRGSDPADPPSFRHARSFLLENIAKWL